MSVFTCFKLKSCEQYICTFQCLNLSSFNDIKLLLVLAKQSVSPEYINECYCLNIVPGYFNISISDHLLGYRLDRRTTLHFSLDLCIVPLFLNPMNFFSLFLQKFWVEKKEIKILFSFC